MSFLGRTLRKLKHYAEAAGAWSVFYFGHYAPFKFASNVCAALSRLVGPRLFPSERARANIKACFPTFSDEKIEEIVKEMWDNFARVAIEYSSPQTFWDGKNVQNIEIVGAEYLQHFKDDDKPGIIFTAHLANWQMITLAARSLGLELTQMYRSANNPYVDSLMRMCQKFAVQNVITKKRGGPRALLSLLKKKEHAFLLIDQKMGEGIPVPFLGREAMTATGPAWFYLSQNCPLLPARCERITPFTFRVTFYPPLKFTPTEDPEKDTYNFLLAINTLMGEWITERPGQWLWVHRRWT